MGKQFCRAVFKYDISDQCCKTENTLFMGERNVIPGKIYVFGTNDTVTINHQWITSAQDHYPTDLGLVSPGSLLPGSFFMVNPLRAAIKLIMLFILVR